MILESCIRDVCRIALPSFFRQLHAVMPSFVLEVNSFQGLCKALSGVHELACLVFELTVSENVYLLHP